MPPTFAQTVSPMPSSPDPWANRPNARASSFGQPSALFSFAPGTAPSPFASFGAAGSTPSGSSAARVTFGSGFTFGSSTRPSAIERAVQTPPPSSTSAVPPHGSISTLSPFATAGKPDGVLVGKSSGNRLLHDMFESGEYSDILVQTAGKQEFKLHRAVLCRASPWFKKFCEVSGCLS